MAFLSSAVWQRYIAAGFIALFLLPSVSSASTPATQDKTADQVASGDETVQPKFIWGILIKFVASKAFDMFFEWAKKAMFQGLTQSLFVARGAAVSAPGDAILAPASKSALPIMPNVTDNVPSVPLSVEKGKENYQGIHLALLVLQSDGQSLKVRPISEGFKSGEKFRLRVVSTFDGEFSLDNVNPQSGRNRLYPENLQQIVKMKSGKQVILPLESDVFFQFDDVAGEESLVITLRDPRAQGDATSHALVHRGESEQGTGLLQEVSAGQYAAIAESIALQHRK